MKNEEVEKNTAEYYTLNLCIIYAHEDPKKYFFCTKLF